jgi:hypothetical protein
MTLVRVFLRCRGCQRRVEGEVPQDPRRLRCSACGRRNPEVTQEVVPLPPLPPRARGLEVGKGFAPEFSRGAA